MGDRLMPVSDRRFNFINKTFKRYLEKIYFSAKTGIKYG